MKSVGMIAAMCIFAVCPVFAQDFLAAPQTVSSWDEVFGRYCAEREALPPLPSTVPYTEVFERIVGKDASFITDSWALNLGGGTLYVSGEGAFVDTLPM